MVAGKDRFKISQCFPCGSSFEYVHIEVPMVRMDIRPDMQPVPRAGGNKLRVSLNA